MVVTMMAAGMEHDRVLALAVDQGVRATHLQQLVVPQEEEACRRLLLSLIQAMRVR